MDKQFPQKKKKNKVKIILIISVIAVILLFLIAFLWGNNIPLLKKAKWVNKKWINSFRCWTKIDKSLCKQEKEEIEHIKIYMKALDHNTKIPIETEFMLKLDGDVISQGKLRYNAWEEFNKAVFNKTYTLYAWDDDNKGDDYYFSKAECIPIKKKEYCTLSLKKQGKIELELHELENNKYILRLMAKDGLIREPLICYKWSPFRNILDINLSETMIEKPFELKIKYDKCYKIETIKAVRDTPLSENRLNSEIINLHRNCSYSFTMDENETIKEIENLYEECKNNPKQSKENLIEEYNRMYSICILQEESQRDVINTFTALYEKCDKKEQTKKDMLLEIKTTGKLDETDKIEFLVLDEGDYRDGNNIVKSYFGLNEKDIGAENIVLIKEFG